jgi:hypothetical protein
MDWYCYDILGIKNDIYNMMKCLIYKLILLVHVDNIIKMINRNRIEIE